MYKLGKQFELNSALAKANPNNVIKGLKYRISVLTERLIRLEYSPTGIFEDRPSQRVWKRDMGQVDFKIKQDEKYLEISTAYFDLFYHKEMPFQSNNKLMPDNNLKIVSKENNKHWYYGHPEVRNFGVPSFKLNKKKLIFEKSLYSIDGFVSIDDSASQVIEETGDLSKRNEETDIYVFMYGKDFEKGLHDYYELTGFPALIPRYALGNWWTRNIKYDEKEIKNLVSSFNDSKIPLSTIILNDEWHINEFENIKDIKTGFTFNPELFKNPKELIDYVHSKGVRLGLNINPSGGILPYETYYEKALSYLGGTKGSILPLDLNDPKNLDIYLKLMIHPLDNLGVDFYQNGTSDKKDLFLLNHYHFYDMMRDYKRRPLLLTSFSNIAPHRYPVLYSGETIVSWDTLKLLPLYNSSSANSGVSFWSHDIGGFHRGIEDDELYVRYVQLGTFSPILKFGSQKGKYYKREPWKWDVKTFEITKKYLNLRHKLLPYLYTESYKYYKEGKPIIKPIYYKHPEMVDDELYKNEYYFGSELFISPIVKPKEKIMDRVIHRFFIPSGIWYDFVTGKKFPGGKNYISFFKDDDYPVFASVGAIIPLGDNENINDTTPPKNLEIHIFPGKNNTYTLYEDDGVSDLYKKGFYLLTSIDYNYLPSNYTVIIRALEGKSGIVPERRNYKIRFRNTREATDVMAYFNNEPLQFISYTEGADFIVEIEGVPTIGQFTLNCKGKNIEIDALKLINEDIESILFDLKIETEMKELIDSIIFSELSLNKKRIALRKLKKAGLQNKFIRLFLKLLEYVNEINKIK
jgi:alpha-glucosidase (family GH31 glycosyl hydrolase)